MGVGVVSLLCNVLLGYPDALHNFPGLRFHFLTRSFMYPATDFALGNVLGRLLNLELLAENHLLNLTCIG